MISARQATPGTKVIIAGTGLGTAGSCAGLETRHCSITVGRWEGNGDGTATLVSVTGQYCGRYSADTMFATTLAESVNLSK